MSTDIGSPTWVFGLWWANDERLYYAVLAYAANVKRKLPAVTDPELGALVIGTVRRWCQSGYVDTVGHNAPGVWPPAPVEARVLAMMADEVGDWAEVDPAEVGESVTEAQGGEDIITVVQDLKREARP